MATQRESLAWIFNKWSADQKKIFVADVWVFPCSERPIFSGLHGKKAARKRSQNRYWRCRMTALPKCDCLDWCGDDPWIAKGKAEWCDEHKAKVNQAALIETITWTLTAKSMPTPQHLVLGFSSDAMEQIVVCSHDGAVWRYHDDEIWHSGPMAWAAMPFGPRNTPWMKVRRP